MNAGANSFSGTFTGIGERAGNAPIEEVCTALRFIYKKRLPVKYEKLNELCSEVSKYSGIGIQKHKPVIGENAFSHESGIHVDGILKHPRTYENFNPKFVGGERRFVFGKHSGMNAIVSTLKKHGYGNKGDIRIFLKEVKLLSEKNMVSFTEDEIIELFKKCEVL